MTFGLTPRQRETLTFIEQYIAARGCSPTYDEIKDGLGIGSKSGVHRLVVALERRGHVKRLPNMGRSITVIQKLEAA